MKKIILLFLFSGLFFYAQAQNNALSSNFINPSVPVRQGPNGTDALIAVGYFDNYTVSAIPGMMSTTVVCNPVNSANWIGTDMRITGYVGSPLVFYTTNYGVNWASSTVTASSGDPVLAADTHNNIFLGYLNSNVYPALQKSTNGGVSWGTATTIVSNSNASSPWFWCDKTSGPYTNYVYMNYVNFNTYEIEFWRSTNNGVNWALKNGAIGWGTPEPVPNGICDKDGNVYCIYYGGGLNMKKSTDGGTTFGGTVPIASFAWPGNYNSTSGRYYLKNYIRVSACPQIACDITNGPYTNYIYCVWCENPAGPYNADIYFSKSTDHGANWSSQVKINDDNTYLDHWMPAISVDSLGRVFVYWYDSRNDPTNNLLTEEWGTCSTNGGTTFMPNFKISNQHFHPDSVKIYQANQDYYMGFYQGIASGGKNTIAFYTCQNNSLNDYMAYLPDYGMYFSKSPDTVGRNSTYPQSVKIPMMGPFTGTVNYSANLTTPPSTGTIYLTFPNPSKVLTGSPDSILLNVITTINVTPGNYTVNVTGTEVDGPRTHTRSFTLVVTNVTGISNNNQNIPDEFALYQNYPNPFNPTTKIRFALKEDGRGKKEDTKLVVYDILGKEIAILVNEQLQPGTYEVTFDGSNYPSGIYFYQLRTNDYTNTKKLILLK
jgi:hypothetical protein